MKFIGLVFLAVISLGVMCYNTQNSIITHDEILENLSPEEFNVQFDKYVGEKQRASVAKGLIDKVIANNTSRDTKITVETLNGGGYTGAIGPTSDSEVLMTIRNGIVTKDTLYKITVEGYDANGIISAIKISGVNKTHVIE